MNFKQSDCGRVEGERRDCTVRACATAFNVSYSKAHDVLKRAGRQDEKGIKFNEVVRNGFLNELGDIELRSDLCCRSLGKILPEMQSGRFIVRIHRHTFAIVDGVLIDLFLPKMGTSVKMVYQIK